MRRESTIVTGSPGVPLRSANSVLDKLDACSYVKFHGVPLRMASQRLLRTVPTNICKRGSTSSPKLNRSSTASVCGPRLIKGEPGAESGMTSGIGSGKFLSSANRNTSAGRRWWGVRWRAVEGVLGGRVFFALGVNTADSRIAAEADRCRTSSAGSGFASALRAVH